METIGRNIEDLLAFHAVAREGSFTQAALTLGTSKAMISKQVRRLETYSRVQLFQRTTRRVQLTEQGMVLFEYSQRIFALSQEAGQKLHEMTRGLSGTIRLAAPVSFGESFMPDFLKSMKRSLPQVKFEIDLANEKRDFNKDLVDFAIRADDDHHPELIARHLGQLKDVICATPVSLGEFSAEGDPRDLEKMNCITASLDETWNIWNLNSSTREIAARVQGNYSTNQYSAIKSLCLAGLGVARLPYYYVREELEAKKLIRLYPAYQVSTHPLYLVYQKSEYPSVRHQQVKEGILQWFKSHREIFI